MNILVIGGSGLFGRKIVIHLLRDKDVSGVVSMDIVPPPEWLLKSIEPHTGKFHFVRDGQEVIAIGAKTMQPDDAVLRLLAGL